TGCFGGGWPDRPRKKPGGSTPATSCCRRLRQTPSLHRLSGFTKTPYNSREPTLQRFNHPRFTIHDLTHPNGAQSHPSFPRHRNLGARRTSSFPAATSRCARRSCHRPDRIRFRLAASAADRRLDVRDCLVRAFPRTCFSSKSRLGRTFSLPPVRLAP